MKFLWQKFIKKLLLHSSISSRYKNLNYNLMTLVIKLNSSNKIEPHFLLIKYQLKRRI
jgi:hypothetical protein